MRDPIARYVSDLDAILHFELPEDRLESIVMEAESHLRESASRRVAEVTDPIRAQTEAIDAYGSPQRVAVGHLRRAGRKMWGLHPGYWAALGALVSIACWNFHWLTLDRYFDNFGNTWQNGLAGLIGLAALTLPIKAARRRFRSNWSALILVTVGAAALSIPLTAFWMIPSTDSRPRGFAQGISRFHLKRDLPAVQSNIADIRAYQDLVRQGIRSYATATTERQIPGLLMDPSQVARRFGVDHLGPALVGTTITHAGKFVVPREYGAFAMVDGRTWVFESSDRFEFAKKQWATVGPSDLRNLDYLLLGFQSIERNALEAKHGRLFFFCPDLYTETVIGTLILLPLFLAIDALAVLSARPRGQRRGRVVA
ncbi:MAG: hypothetical protein P4L46_02625 [Fimbriimonas sp.]|nr:hypothetical protein [Fimbriimonas sp.]